MTPYFHLYGDSISRGYALGGFLDTLPTTHPLYNLGAIWQTANVLMLANGLPPAWTYTSMSMDGSTDLSYIEAVCDGIRAKLDNGEIRGGDYVIFEDAGPFPGTPGEYYDRWMLLREAVTSQHAVNCILMTMFDYPPAATEAQYDLVRSGETYSMNQKTIMAAQEDIDAVGQTFLIDMNAFMDAWKTSAWNGDGVKVLFDDGIHVNVWGQMFLLGHLLKITRLIKALPDLSSIKNLCSANHSTLGYGTTSPTWTSSRAGAYADYCLKR